jgi:type IV pilus assembly protein PilC
MKYNYQAKDTNGEVKSGMVVAADQQKAEGMLAENGWAIISIELRQESFLEQLNPFDKFISGKELVLFTRQLATLIAARVPLLQSLRILESQLTNKRLVAIAREVMKSIENGESLSLALSKYPSVFGGVYVSLVRSGEVSGTLNKSLVYLADQMEKDYELKSKVKSAMTYPAFIIGTLFAVALLMFKFVLPKLTEVLVQQGGELPTVSKVLIGVTNFINVFWWVLLLGAGLGFILLRLYIATPNGRYFWDKLKLQVPIINGIFLRIYLARFARNLSTLVAGGIPIIQAIQIVAEIINNVIYRDILVKTAERLAGGESINSSLQGFPEFPPIVTQMVRVGEETAQLDEILGKLASFYEKEVDDRVSVLTTLLEPLIMIILGLGVGALVAGILLPIYNLASTVG